MIRIGSIVRPLHERITELEQENAALWHFARTGERSALRKLDPNTSDSEAIKRAEPRTLGTDNPTSENLKG